MTQGLSAEPGIEIGLSVPSGTGDIAVRLPRGLAARFSEDLRAAGVTPRMRLIESAQVTDAVLLIAAAIPGLNGLATALHAVLRRNDGKSVKIKTPAGSFGASGYSAGDVDRLVRSLLPESDRH